MGSSSPRSRFGPMVRERPLDAQRCALQAVAGLGPRRPRRGYEQPSMSGPRAASAVFSGREDYSMDANAKKTTLRMIPYGLYVLTAAGKDGQVGAATVNWVTQASFAPPLVVVG